MMSERIYLFEALRYAAANSKDPRTQVGAVIVVGKKLVYGANVQPVTLACDKYLSTEHAERAAIYKAAACGIPTAGATMYAPWFACTDCARGIILAGIREVVGLAALREATPPRWQENLDMADRMLAKAGVATRWLAGPIGATIRFDGREFPC